MKITNDLLLELMQRVDQGLEVLLSDIAMQQNEIEKLTTENKHLRENYTKISEQISLYIAELEAIKHSKT
jgi:cell division protein FtsB